MDYDAGVALLAQVVGSSPPASWTTADSQAACIEAMECCGFSEHQSMKLSQFEDHLKAGLQLFHAYTQGRLRVRDRELHVRLLSSSVCSTLEGRINGGTECAAAYRHRYLIKQDCGEMTCGYR